MQNVAWPIMIVSSPSEMPNVLNDELRAIAVTIPGRVIGRTNINDSEFRPKKR